MKTRLDLGLVLPEASDDPTCRHRLLSRLKTLRGVVDAHIPESSGDTELCIHYDSEALSLSRIRALVLMEGASLAERYGHFVWEVHGLSNARKADTVAAALRKIPGVVEVGSGATGFVRVGYDRSATAEGALRSALAKLGVQQVEGPAKIHEGHDHEGHGHKGHDHGGGLGAKAELAFSLLGGILLATGYALATFSLAPPGVVLAAYLGAYALSGAFMLKEAIQSVRAGRFEIDFLMLIAAVGAGILGEWAEGALLLVLFSLGHALEGYAMGRARRAIEALAELAPEHATVKRDGTLQEIGVEDLVLGDVVLVKPNERLPIDGLVLVGESAVNQAPITGESIPVDKDPLPDPRPLPHMIPANHRVFAGSINGSGALEVEVTKLASESTLARVAELVREAETQRSPTQVLTDRFERVFVPSVLALVVLLLFAWLVVDESMSASFYRAMAVLVAASPCALAIATPSAVLSAVARAGSAGVLVKGGGPLESLGQVSAIAFDKTGTLTEGRPEVSDVVPSATSNEDELLAVAASAELLSDHPLAQAVVRAANARSLELIPAQGLHAVTGKGIVAQLAGTPVRVGSARLFAEDPEGVPDPLAEETQRLATQGRTVMIVQQGGRYLGVIGVMDQPRASSKPVIQELSALGIARMIMISGDRQEVATALASSVGLAEAVGDLMPDDKVKAIEALAAESAVIAMVGDGVNDAPALAAASVGIAMGAAGSDVALETADIALMGDDLTQLPFAVELGRQTASIIRQNLWLSLGMVFILIPATVFGLGIGPAVALHEGSTLVVVFNALRLLGFRPRSSGAAE